MRISAGQFAGRLLCVPPGRLTRPTSARVREALFQIVAVRTADGALTGGAHRQLEGRTVLDLFAGSGALGLEALSRGARSAWFVESHPAALACIERNIATLGAQPRTHVHRGRLPQALDRLGGVPFDLVLCDPPYRFPGAKALLEGLRGRIELAPDAIVVYEHDAREHLPTVFGLEELERRAWGDTAATFYCARS